MIDKQIIFWDFDGVIMDSNSIRNKGFELVLQDFPKEEVAELLKYHNKNGGLSRYVKFKYFFETIRKERVSDSEVLAWAKKFSKIMLKELCKKELLLEETISFIKKVYLTKRMHIVSASDQEELRTICKNVEIDKYFESIHGSPITKTINVKNLIKKNNYKRDNIVLIGDSINDYNAAQDNGVSFIGFNNVTLKKLGNYINNF